MNLREIVHLIAEDLGWKPVEIAEEDKKDTDEYLIGDSCENPLKEQIERARSFFTEPEVTTPADQFIIIE